MSTITAQVSLYPLQQTAIGPVIREAVRTLREQGVGTRMGEMSTQVWGEEPMVFAALQQVFHQAAGQGKVVMVVTFSNACPDPGSEVGPSSDRR
jgi:uncharacterized protein YqgV (UPF0045/DUF77 family)